MKLLICGDSFAADWTSKYPGTGWPNLLSEKYSVTNLAQAGCSEYKIYLQLTSVKLHKYDAIIISHTSPNRIYVKTHPVHCKDILHKNSDLIYADIVEHSNSDPSLTSIVDYFENYFDLNYATFIHNLICEKIENYLLNYTGSVIHIAHIDQVGLHKFPDLLNFDQLHKTYPGLINHYSNIGNQRVFETINDMLTNR